MLDLTRSTIRRAGQVRLPQAAASLTLTTALSIVPLLAVGFALFRRFPVFRPLELAIEQHLFKALKQNLKIKTFVGTSANAVRTQIWTALICMLLLRYLQLRSRFGWSMANLVALLRMNLFTHRDLRAWIDEPFAAPPDPSPSPQADIAFA